MRLIFLILLLCAVSLAQNDDGSWFENVGTFFRRFFFGSTTEERTEDCQSMFDEIDSRADPLKAPGWFNQVTYANYYMRGCDKILGKTLKADSFWGRIGKFLGALAELPYEIWAAIRNN